MFPSISPKQSFPALESEILAFWKANNTFQKSIDSRPEDNPYRFYDGPPFITGTPHYGSLLSSIVKDVVGRYWTMRGKRVDRIWGWDCHGLPIEEKVQKKLGLKSNKEIEERGVKEFIDGCYEYTQSTSAEWDWYIEKIGRWVDMDHAYRTMDQDYMESVMWVFSQLWNKGLIYEGKRVSLYSWKLGTPISNFEVAMDDTYQEVNDPAITVKFKPETRKATAVIVENKKGEILLGLHKKGYWMLPGGKAEGDETFEQCATRELLEETGIEYEITESDITSFEHYDIIGGKIYDNRRYRIQLSDPNFVIGEPEKFSEWKFFSKDSLPENMFEPSRHSFENVVNGVSQKNNPLSILAWTTTPWTIPANMALAVRNDIDYVLVSQTPPLIREAGRGTDSPLEGSAKQGVDVSESFIVAKNRAESVFKGKGEYTIIREFKGSELVGLGYIPPFPEYYYDKFRDGSLDPIPLIGGAQGGIVSETTPAVSGVKNPNHKIYHADFITDTDGTGIGHEAPEFGDVDFQLAKKEGIFISEAMDEAGKYTSQIFDYEGTHYLNLEEPEKGANRINIERMKENNTLFKLENITHRVPFCPRSGTPLMQKAQASWFIDIQSQKDKLLKANEQINWFPEHLKFGRFAKGIESAPDWCISRTRYWGAPMPVWQNQDGSERVVVSSREEIFEMNKTYGQLTKLIITRHAESVANVENHFDDIGISPLSENGKIQAEKLMQELKNQRVDIIITSPFLRAIETAEPLAKKLGVEIITDDRLIEAQHGKLANVEEGIDTKSARKRLFREHQYQFGDTGESYDHIYTRMKDFVEDICIKYPGKTVFIVTHGIPTKVITELLNDGKAPEKSHNAQTRTFILDVANKNLLNLHKPYIDSIKLQSPKTGEELFRIPEVLDVWMDSGSMPYAQMHYPFANKEAMEASFPADFIAEYVGQVRAWFYVMHVLGVLLNPNKKPIPTPSFTNVITTGVINGNDGRKMSKSFGNYPDPRLTIEKYGSDPIRFYMLNSPLLSGGDMDFKEEQIIETVKGVMLPIWNTYSFFTTYANIDGWKKDETEVWFTRHAESTSNVAGMMSDGTDNPELTEKGKQQAYNAGKTLREQGKNFDIIIHTGLTRTIETARIIGDVIGFTGEYISDDGFIEQYAGEYAGKTLEEIAKIGGIPSAEKENHDAIRRIYKNNQKENIEQFESRILDTFEKVLAKYKGKRILVVGHSGTSRPIQAKYFGKGSEKAHFGSSIIHAEPFRLMTTPIINPLDRWILSKLQVLTGQVHDAMDGYDITRACRAIVDYMDELTNWYVRLSRRRFWESGMTPDKTSAYETLYTVLLELSKLLAPYMPFLAESIYKGLTDGSPLGKEGAEGSEVSDFITRKTGENPQSLHDSSFTKEPTENSVHLEYITRPSRHLIDNELNRDMEKCERIVSLGLGLRSRKNIRVRQPLQSVTITEPLDVYYQSIIKDELNVKEVQFENPEKLAKKICKPDARKIGPRLGKEVQTIITAAKNGDFQELSEGRIQVGSFILEPGEYTLEYLPLEGIGDVEGGYGMVVALDTEISETLKFEGYARDLIRAVQEMRKDADYAITDRIEISIKTCNREEMSTMGSETGMLGTNSSSIISRILSNWTSYIEGETLSQIRENIIGPDREKSVSIEEVGEVTIALKR